MSDTDTTPEIGVDHPTVQTDETDSQLPLETAGFITLPGETFEQLLYWAVYTGFEQAKNVEELDRASQRVIDSTFEQFVSQNIADSTNAFSDLPTEAPTYGRRTATRGDQQ